MVTPSGTSFVGLLAWRFGNAIAAVNFVGAAVCRDFTVPPMEEERRIEKMKIDQHSVTLTIPTRVPAQTRGAQTGSTTSGQATKTMNSFAALVAGRLPVANSVEGMSGETAGASTTTKTTAATVSPLAGWVTCAPPAPNPATSTASTAATDRKSTRLNSRHLGL